MPELRPSSTTSEAHFQNIQLSELRVIKLFQRKHLSVSKLQSIFLDHIQWPLMLKRLQKYLIKSTFSFTYHQEIVENFTDLINSCSGTRVKEMIDINLGLLQEKFPSLTLQEDQLRFSSERCFQHFSRIIKGQGKDEAVMLSIILELLMRRQQEVQRFEKLFAGIQASKIEIDKLKAQGQHQQVPEHDDVLSEQILRKCLTLLDHCVEISEKSAEQHLIEGSEDFAQQASDHLFLELQKTNHEISDRVQYILKSRYENGLKGMMSEKNVAMHKQLNHMFQWKLAFLNKLSYKQNNNSSNPAIVRLLANIKVNLVEGLLNIFPHVSSKNQCATVMPMAYYGVLLKDTELAEKLDRHQVFTPPFCPHKLPKFQVETLHQFEALLDDLCRFKSSDHEIINRVYCSLYLEIDRRINEIEFNAPTYLFLLEAKKTIACRCGFKRYSNYRKNLKKLHHNLLTCHKEYESSFFVPRDMIKMIKELILVETIMIGAKDQVLEELNQFNRHSFQKQYNYPQYQHFMFSEGAFANPRHFSYELRESQNEILSDLVTILPHLESNDLHLEKTIQVILEEYNIQGSMFYLLQDKDIVRELLQHPKIKLQSWTKKQFIRLVQLCNDSLFKTKL